MAKVCSKKTRIHNDALNIVIKNGYPSPNILPEVVLFDTLVNKIPYNGVKCLAKVNKEKNTFLASVYSIMSFKNLSFCPINLPFMKPV